MSRFRSSRGALVAVVLAVVGAGPALAHEVNLVTTLFSVGAGGAIGAEIRLKGSDLDRAAGTRVHDAAADRVRPDALAAAEPALQRYFAVHAGLRVGGGAPCDAAPSRLTAQDDHVIAKLQWTCADDAGEIVYRSDILTAVDRAARQIVVLADGPASRQAVLTADIGEARIIGAGPSLLAVAAQYVLAGIEHIFIGYDHIAFIVGVLLWASRVWPVVKVVTAFTIAHSLTLSLAVLGLVQVPAAIVEPLIAASVIFVALENFRSRDVGRRWKYTFLIGLIHGFGFAGVLEDLGLPSDALALALTTFNVGVEIGQIAIIVVFLPALLLVERVLRRHPDGLTGQALPAHGPMVAARNTTLIYLISGMTGLLGLYWLVERTLL